MKKQIFTFMFLMLMFSIFAVSAQEDSSEVDEFIEDSVDVLGSDEVEVYEEGEDSIELEEFEEVSEYEEVEEGKQEISSLTRVTVGKGFVLSSDESRGEFFQGVWAVKNFIAENEEGEDIENLVIKRKEFGFVKIGIGKDKEKYRLRKQIFDEEGLAFDLISKDGEVAGSLVISPQRYETFTLWRGELKIDSGNYADAWDVTTIARTKVIKPKIDKPAAWNIFARGQRKKAKIREKVQERLFEKEGMGDFIRENKGRDFSRIDLKDRKFLISQKERVQKRVEENDRLKDKYKELREKEIERREKFDEKDLERREELRAKLTARRAEIIRNRPIAINQLSD